ncbi:MAG: hypothetical protein RLY58_282 [Pseudomonadota bacterium]|jgi:zinc transport system substrate-binding protein
MLIRMLCLCWLCVGIHANAAAALVTSIHPLYLIAQAVTQGIEQPVRLIPPQQDGHHVQLTPKDRQSLKQSDFVLWIGPEYEAALSQTLTNQRNAVALTSLHPAFRRLALRDVQGHAIPHSLDPHLWLDPNNANTIATIIAHIRAKQYPQHAKQYQQNAQAFRQRMTLVAHQQQITPQHYWAYHDAYQYLESSLQLTLTGSLTTDPELPPTLKQLQWLKQQPQSTQRCVFSPHPLNHGLLTQLQPIQFVVIDETLSQSTDFIQGWRNIVNQSQTCLKINKI